MDFLMLGSALSLRSYARLGSALSAMDFTQFGSSLSLRSLCRLGSTMSLFSATRFGSTLSMLDFVRCGRVSRLCPTGALKCISIHIFCAMSHESLLG